VCKGTAKKVFLQTLERKTLIIPVIRRKTPHNIPENCRDGNEELSLQTKKNRHACNFLIVSATNRIDNEQ
jgi:hypothetical protein